MNFPITVCGLTFTNPRAFSAAVIEDAKAGGGRFVEGKRPCVWLKEAMKAGEIDRVNVLSLVAFLAQSDEAAAVAEGIRIALALSLGELSPVFIAVLEHGGLDILLQPDPLTPQDSIQDAFLMGALALMDQNDDESRAVVLRHLRHGGLQEEEAKLILGHGSVEELQAHLPAIWLDLIPTPAEVAVALVRGKDVADVMLSLLKDSSEPYRKQVWEAAILRHPQLKNDKEMKTQLLKRHPSPIAQGS
jgi:hypothetical protein